MEKRLLVHRSHFLNEALGCCTECFLLTVIGSFWVKTSQSHRAQDSVRMVASS